MGQLFGEAIHVLSARHGLDPLLGDEGRRVRGGHAVAFGIVVVLPAGILGVGRRAERGRGGGRDAAAREGAGGSPRGDAARQEEGGGARCHELLLVHRGKYEVNLYAENDALLGCWIQI